MAENNDKTPTAKTEKQVPAPAARDSFSSFRQEMDNLVNAFFGGRAPLAGFPSLEPMRSFTGGMETAIVPAIDVKENEKQITVTAELPGIEPDDVDLSVREGVVTIKGEKKYEHEDEKDDVHMVERRYGSFQRSFRLPESVDEEAIDAQFDKGVLRITLPKKAEAESAQRKIKIKG